MVQKCLEGLQIRQKLPGNIKVNGMKVTRGRHSAKTTANNTPERDEQQTKICRQLLTYACVSKSILRKVVNKEVSI